MNNSKFIVKSKEDIWLATTLNLLLSCLLYFYGEIIIKTNNSEKINSLEKKYQKRTIHTTNLSSDLSSLL